MFQALAIKYRPKTFSELIGQEAVSQTLSLALDTQRLGHAYLFSGLRGSGKTSSARIFAKSLNCDHGPTSKPCGECANCVSALQGRHLDIIEMDAASSRKIDDIRDVIEQTKYIPAMGRYKIFIIDEVHMLTRESYNALLKTLEEPPPYVKFILATTDILKIPATILSRSQHFRFKKIPEKMVINHLIDILGKENIPYEQEALEMITRSGSGSLRDTLTLLDQAIIYSKQSVRASAVAQMLGILDPLLLEKLFDTLLADNKEELFNIAQELENYECEMVLEEFANYLKDQIRNTHTGKLPLAMVDRFFRIITESKNLLYLNANSSFVLTLTLLKMLEALKIKRLDEMIADLEQQVFTHSSTLTPKISTQTQESFTKEAEPINTLEAEATHSKELFALLIQEIYNRSHDLGVCFEKNVSFISYSNGVLSWSSQANEECKKRLREGYSVIKMFVERIFGIGTTIQQIPHTEPKEPKEIAKSTQPPAIMPEANQDNHSTQTTQTTQQATQNIESVEQTTKEPPKPPTLQELKEKIPLVKCIDETLGIKKVTIVNTKD